MFLEFLVCSWGGRPSSDGIDGVASMVVNFSNYPVEVIEREYPLRTEEYGFLSIPVGRASFAVAWRWCDATGSWSSLVHFRSGRIAVGSPRTVSPVESRAVCRATC